MIARNLPYTTTSLCLNISPIPTKYKDRTLDPDTRSFSLEFGAWLIFSMHFGNFFERKKCVCEDARAPGSITITQLLST